MARDIRRGVLENAMSLDQVRLTIRAGNKTARFDATRVVFSPHQCFRFDDGEEDRRCIDLLADHLIKLRGLALYGAGPLLAAFGRQRPDVVSAARTLIVDPEDGQAEAHGLPLSTPKTIPGDVEVVFLCETLAFPRSRMKRRLPAHLTVIDAEILAEIGGDLLPARAWTPITKHIYPIELPEIELEPDLDIVLMDCPARNLALMPNGLGYVHNALKRANVRFQTFDLDIVAYHRYHINRLFDEGGRIVMPDGREMPVDPWQAEHYDLWLDPHVIDHFRPLLHEAATALIKARPKILGLSVQQCNEALSRELIRLVKAERPETIVLVGGFSCYSADVGRRGFPDCDYMCIGEADLTVGPLVERLARGERPRNQPGILSRFDSPDYRFLPAPMPHKLEQLPFPRYDWFNLSLYRNYNGYQLTPIIASRGCRWSRCTFCAERFYWRIRPEEEFVDELEWLVDQGCHLFMFNESDLNGNPEKLLAICDEIIRRDIQVRLTGQLRIHKKSDRAFFDKLRAAGFVALRFGVDAFSDNTLRLQKKGYTKDIVRRNLKDCWEAGIYTEVNWVIGVPGETMADAKEGVEFILENRPYIGRLCNINPLIMVNGSVYWIDPEAHNIVFRRPKEELYACCPRALPADLWYSTHPYIDSAVRRQYFEHIILSLYDAGFPVSAWADRVIDDVKSGRDRVRVGDFSDTAGDDEGSSGTSNGSAQPRLLRSLLGYDLFAFKGRYYGVPKGWTAPDFATFETAPPPEVAVGLTEAGAVTWIERLTGELAQPLSPATAGPPAKPDPKTVEPNENVVEDDGSPRLIRSIGSTNIVCFGDRYYAVPQALGEIDWTRSGELPNGILSAGTLGELQVELDYASRWADARGVLDAQESQRRRGSLFRADSALGEAPSSLLMDRTMVLRGHSGAYAVSREAVAKLELPEHETIEVLYAVSDGAIPELQRSCGNYNIVTFDNNFYALPQGIDVLWGEEDPMGQPGIEVASTLKAILAKIGYERMASNAREDLSSKKTVLPEAGRDVRASAGVGAPRLMVSQDGYNIVEYEGWYYGIPQELGPLDLTETDVIGIPGVIRDVSQSVVEEEIAERVLAGNSRLAAAPGIELGATS
jgi:radical SAM superfamily enzyme YgiQ (UPF0313 family)